MLYILLLALFYATVAYFEVPRMVKNGMRRELYAFAVISLLGFILATGQILNFKLPNLTRGIEILVRPVSKAVERKLFPPQAPGWRQSYGRIEGSKAHFGGGLMGFEERLKERGIVLPESPQPVAAYVPYVVVDGLVFTAGQLPVAAGKMRYTGRVGAELSLDEGRAAARLCVLNALAVVRAAAGSLDNVARVVKLTGYVASAPDFFEQPQVLNGVSELLEEIFEEVGRHARVAVGVSGLPFGAAVELALVVKISVG